jgi:hypothetical protein
MLNIDLEGYGITLLVLKFLLDWFGLIGLI